MENYYTFHRQYGDRTRTDALWPDLTGSRLFSGVMHRHAEFIQTHQLLCAEDWKLFVEQFRTAPDDADLGWRGEYFGKMMRGACMTWQYTKNEALYRLLQENAEAMLETQDELGRFSSYSTACEFKGWDLWCRKYVLLGLLHFHEICRDEALKETIVAALEKHLDYIVERIGPHGVEIGATSHKWLGINSASLLEPVLRMYNLTGKAGYLAFGEYIVDFLCHGAPNIITLALEDQLQPWQYPVRKAYEMMSCFEGLLEYHRITGEEKWKTAVIRFADRVAESDITVIGCAGCEHELFNHSALTQTDASYTGVMQETCVTVTWMKLCAQLLMLTGQPKYADRIEHSLYNALHGAVNEKLCQKNGGLLFDSYSPLTTGTRGRLVGGGKFIAPDRKYGCCAAIGAAGTALPLLLAATASKDGVHLNFYETGTVEAGGFRLRVDTRYPADGLVHITVEEAETAERELALRIPGFAGQGACLSLNHKPLPVPDMTAEGGWLPLCRVWTPGDVLTLQFPMSPRILRPLGVEGKPETLDYLAVAYGPLVLARDAGFAPVGEKVPEVDRVEVTPLETGEDRLLRARVTLGTETLELADFAGCGKNWDEECPMEVWLPCSP